MSMAMDENSKKRLRDLEEAENKRQHRNNTILMAVIVIIVGILTLIAGAGPNGW